MTRFMIGLVSTLLAAGIAAAQDAATDISVATMPPSVVKTVPAAGATDVDPALKEITVTFSKDMLTDHMCSTMKEKGKWH